MTFHIITLFPESLDSYINSSIIGRAILDKKIRVKFYNPRDFTKAPPSHKATAGQSKYRRVDQRPFGGGPGMVLEAESVVKAVEKALPHPKSLSLQRRGTLKNILIIWLSPSGKQFDNIYAEKVAKKIKDVVIICGRYEGIDERVKKITKDLYKIKVEDLSIGPYVVTGGELPAMVIIDTIARRIPGVLGKIESVEENRVSSREVYTRPEILTYKSKKYRVAKVLISGHHAKIIEWRSRKKK